MGRPPPRGGGGGGETPHKFLLSGHLSPVGLAFWLYFNVIARAAYLQQEIMRLGIGGFQGPD